VLELEEPSKLPKSPSKTRPCRSLPEEASVFEAGPKPHWLLSLFARPSRTRWIGRAAITGWSSARRIDSPAGSGELKKTVRMVGEGSVIYAPAAPLGAAPDVAPGGFPHPVFRAGFAVSIPLPE